MILNENITPHETFDLHELLVVKSVTAAKSSVMGGLIRDPELKEIFQQNLITTQNEIKELQDLIQQSVYAPSNSDDTIS